MSYRSRSQDARKKGGRFGNLAQGSVTPGSLFPARPPPTVEATDPTLQFSESFFQSPVVYGRVYEEQLLLSPNDPNMPDAPASWPALLLPPAFVHGNAPPALPAGYAYVRLMEGSGRVPGRSWDADKSTFGIQQNVKTSKPELVQVQVDPDAAQSKLILWFSHNPGELADDPYSKVHVYTTAAEQIEVTGKNRVTNRIEFDLSRDVDPDNEIISVTVDYGLFEPNLTSDFYTDAYETPIPVVYKADRFCYVVVTNRAHNAAIDAGTMVFIGEGRYVYDGASNGMLVYDCVPGGGGGGGTAVVEEFPATIVQRNIDKQETHWSSPAAPTDWTAFDLPVTFKHGDTLPTSGLDARIGWARLRMPSDIIDGKDGMAGNTDATYGSATDTAGPMPSLVRAEIRGTNELYLWFDYNVERAFASLAPGDSWSNYIQVEHALAPLYPLTASSPVAGPATNCVKFTLSGASATQWNEIAAAGDVTVTLTTQDPPVAPRAYIGIIRSTGATVVYVSTVDYVCVFNDARDAYVLVMNRTLDHVIGVGWQVELMPTKYIDLEDDNAVIRRVYDVYTNAPLAVFQWLRIDGGHELNASPLVLGIKVQSPVPADTTPLPAGLSPGSVDGNAIEVTPGSGPFPDYIGYGTLITKTGTISTFKRVLVKNAYATQMQISGWLYWAPIPFQAPIVGDPDNTYTVYKVTI